MLATSVSTLEAPAGYTLLERLGAGGYGEVWKATAPGGVEKAVKVVFGHCDEELAGREFKALQLVKSVRHPFLLTIERYEIVNHRLVIVSELADKSLDARFDEVRQEGLVGLPRDELLAYLADAAEALDWLSEHHSLQHLDVKPENLLILGDHVKIADFGLIKDVAARTLNSLVGGMTPVYSAPEVYDDAPSRWSDQYSLAIVFQQMLTGTLPFPGRTPAQLAKQHMLAAPNLTPLSEADRQAIGRALQKQPQARFNNCRQLIESLKQQSAQPSGARGSCTGVDGQPLDGAEEDTRRSSELLTTPFPPAQPLPSPNPLECGGDSSLAGAPKREVRYPSVSVDVVDAKPPAAPMTIERRTEPTLFVGVGGVGLELLSRIRQAAAKSHPNESKSAWLAIDTDPDAIKELATGPCGRLFANDDLLRIPLRRPKQYRDCSQDLLKWLSRRWLYNIPRSLLTRGYRPLGRLALADNADQVLEALSTKIAALVAARDDQSEREKKVRVVILAGASGGTGSGCAIDLAQAARSAASSLAVPTTVDAILGCTCADGRLDSLAAANMYSFLTEFAHAQRQGNQGETRPVSSAAYFELPDKPFDRASLISIPAGNDDAKREMVLQSVVDFVALDSTAVLAPMFDGGPQADDAAQAAIRLDVHSCTDLAAVQVSMATRGVENLVSGFLAYCFERADNGESGMSEELGEFQNCRISKPLVYAIENARNRDDSDEVSLPRERHSASEAAEFCRRIADLRRSMDAAHLTDAQMDRRQQLYADLLKTICAELARGKDVSQLSLADWVERLRSAASSGFDQELAETACDDALDKQETGFERPLACGVQRLRALIDAAQSHVDWIDKDELRQTVKDVLTPEDAGKFLLTVGTGVVPLYIGARLAESFPDIEEAAGRLHARSDLKWRLLSDYA